MKSRTNLAKQSRSKEVIILSFGFFHFFKLTWHFIPIHLSFYISAKWYSRQK